MPETPSTRGRNVIYLSDYQPRQPVVVTASPARTCRHCSAVLGEGETEDDCSTFLIGARLRWPMP